MSAEPSMKPAVGRPFARGHDPRRDTGAHHKRRAKLRKRLAAFDAKAWATLERLFESEDPHLELEALKFWGKYRLDCLLKAKDAEDKAQGAAPTMPTKVAAAIASLDS